MTGPRTVADVLDPLADALHDGDLARRELTGLVAAARPVVESRVAEVLAGELRIDLTDTVLTAWTQYRALVDAGRRTRDDPRAPEDVVLAEHTIAADHHPAVDVLIDGQVVASWTFDVELAMVVRAVVAVVEAGRLTAVRAGEVEVGAALSLHGFELCRRTRRVLAGQLVRLGSGVPLVPSPAGPAPGPAPWWQRT